MLIFRMIRSVFLNSWSFMSLQVPMLSVSHVQSGAEASWKGCFMRDSVKYIGTFQERLKHTELMDSILPKRSNISEDSVMRHIAISQDSSVKLDCRQSFFL